MTKRQQTIRERIERDFSSMALTTEQTRRCEYIQDLLAPRRYRCWRFAPRVAS